MQLASQLSHVASYALRQHVNADGITVTQKTAISGWSAIQFSDLCARAGVHDADPERLLLIVALYKLLVLRLRRVTWQVTDADTNDGQRCRLCNEQQRCHASASIVQLTSMWQHSVITCSMNILICQLAF